MLEICSTSHSMLNWSKIPRNEESNGLRTCSGPTPQVCMLNFIFCSYHFWSFRSSQKWFLERFNTSLTPWSHSGMTLDTFWKIHFSLFRGRNFAPGSNFLKLWSLLSLTLNAQMLGFICWLRVQTTWRRQEKYRLHKITDTFLRLNISTPKKTQLVI